MYAKTLVAGRHPLPALVGTAPDVSILLGQLLERGWALFGTTPSDWAAGELLIGTSRLQLVVDGQPLLDDVNPAGPPGWWAAVDDRGGRCAVIICADHDLDLTSGDTGAQLAALMDTGKAVHAALPVRTDLT